MAIVMTYGGSTFTCSRDPSIDGYLTSRQWWNPSIRSGGGKSYVYEKTAGMDIVTLTWKYIDQTDLINLRAFLIAAGRNVFQITLPDGKKAQANFWGPSKLLWTPVELMERDFTIELLLVSVLFYLTDNAGKYITDESSNKIIASVPCELST
jgi:hypothetical protein